MIDLGKVYAGSSKLGKILFIVAFSCIVLFLMDKLVFGAILSRMRVMDAEIEAKQETIKRNLRILAFENSIVEEYTTFKDYLDTGEQSQEEIIGALLRKIENLAKKQSISILNVRPGDVEENPVFQKYKTSLECEGDLNDLLMFMNLLEESDYLFQITRYDMSPKSKKAELVKMSMDLERILITAEKLPT